MKKKIMGLVSLMVSVTSVAKADIATQPDIYPMNSNKQLVCNITDNKRVSGKFHFVFDSAKSNKMVSSVALTIGKQKDVLKKSEIAQYALNKNRVLLIAHDSQNNRLRLWAVKPQVIPMAETASSSDDTVSNIDVSKNLYIGTVKTRSEISYCYGVARENKKGDDSYCGTEVIEKEYQASCKVKTLNDIAVPPVSGVAGSVELPD